MTFKEFQEMKRQIQERAFAKRNKKKLRQYIDLARLRIFWKETSEGTYVVKVSPLKIRTKD